MKNKEIEKKLRMEIKNETPNVLDNVLAKCKPKTTNNISHSTAIFGNRLILAASFIILLFVGFISYNSFANLNKTNTIIELDVNPSVELKLNKNRKILEAIPLNNDGEKILKDMDLNGSSLNVGMNAIIGAMYKNGYLSELKNSVLVSVKSDNKKEQEKIQQELTNEINNILSNYSIVPSILSQEYTEKNNDKAKENGISNGKADFIEKILQAKLANKDGKLYTFDDLANLNINELNAIINSKNIAVNNITTTGTASTKKYIDNNKAKEIVLKDANVSEKNVYDYEIELDYEYGIMIYEIDFDYNGKEYEYELDAVTGKILNRKIEKDDDYSKATNNNATNKSYSSSNLISRLEAKNIAFKDAGVKSNVEDLEIELDKEKGKNIYEISFKYNGKEYEYDIDAISGKIIKKDIEIDD